MLSEEKVWR